MRIGLTGSIGTGKSTAAMIFAKEGIPVIDADEMVHQLYREGPIKNILKDIFGAEIFDEKNEISRSKLGELVVKSETLLEKLNAIVHPIIYSRICNRGQVLLKTNKIVLFDIPLLIETKMFDLVDVVVLIACEESIQVQRIIQRDQCTEVQARRKIDLQLSQEKKKEYADYIIENKGDIHEFQMQIQNLIRFFTDGKGAGI